MASSSHALVYTFQHTFRQGLSAVPGVTVRYQRARQSITGTTASAPNATVTATSDAAGTFTAVDLVDAYRAGSSLTALERYNWTAVARAYGFRTAGNEVFTNRVLYQGGVSMSSGYSEEVQLSPVANLGGISQATAAALAVTFVASGSTGGTVTVGDNLTTQQVFAAYRAWISTLANFDSSDTWTFDGSTLNLGAWNIVVSGGFTLSGGAITTTGTATGAGTYAAKITSASGANGTLVISGLSSAQVYIQDGTGTQQQFESSFTGTYSLTTPVGSTGTWKAVVNRPGYLPAVINFPATGATTADVDLVQITNPDGAVLYTGSTPINVVVNFTGGIATAEIAGASTLTDVFDALQNAYSTAAGMAWLAGGGAEAAAAVLAAGTYIFMPNNTRLWGVDSNSALGAVAISADNTVNHPSAPFAVSVTQPPAGVSAAQIAAAVRAAMATELARLDVAVSSRASQATVLDVKAKTDAITFTQAGAVDANIRYVNSLDVQGSGTEADPWGP